MDLRDLSAILFCCAFADFNQFNLKILLCSGLFHVFSANEHADIFEWKSTLF